MFSERDLFETRDGGCCTPKFSLPFFIQDTTLGFLGYSSWLRNRPDRFSSGAVNQQLGFFAILKRKWVFKDPIGLHRSSCFLKVVFMISSSYKILRRLCLFMVTCDVAHGFIFKESEEIWVWKTLKLSNHRKAFDWFWIFLKRSLLKG